MRTGWFLLSAALCLPLAVACGDDDDDGDDGNAGEAGDNGGTGGTGTTSGTGGGGRSGATATGGGGRSGGGGGATTAGVGAGGLSGGGADAVGGGGTDAIGGGGADAVGGGGTDAVGGGGAAGAGGDAAGAGGTGGAVVPLTDGQVLKVLDTINLGEVQQGQVAVQRATAAAVRQYAEMMVTEHTAAHEKAVMFSMTASLALQNSPLSAQLTAESAALVNALQQTPASAFDIVYMGSQVAVHQQALATIDEVLLPESETPALDTLLTQQRADVAEHLEMAQEILLAIQPERPPMP